MNTKSTMNSQNVLERSLLEYMNSSSSRKDFEESLAPKIRNIKITKLQNVKTVISEIDTILSLSKNGIDQHAEHIVITLESSIGKAKAPLSYPFYGFEKLAGPPATKSAVLLNLLNRISAIAKSGESCTIRDVFYMNVELYNNQQVVSESLREIADAFKVTDLNELGIYAAQKGLCFTPVALHFDMGNMILSNQKSLVPLMSSSVQFSGNWSLVKRVVVVEKDAIFSKLIENTSLNKECIFITGKGFPDWLTRYFLYKLMVCCPPEVDFEIYTDSDPYGIEIALKYIYNGVKIEYQCPRLIYRGVMIQDLLRNPNGSRNGLQLLNLSCRDSRYALKLLTRLEGTNLKMSKKRVLMQELQRQLFYQKKAEMNTVCEANFAQYLMAKSPIRY
ncbi:LAFA_0D09142g1_1 [Lachancea sp. 'fantastica']|nr:LAFA_0D09142g1_1 [Lachancea sp. 'fantastica']